MHRSGNYDGELLVAEGAEKVLRFGAQLVDVEVVVADLLDFQGSDGGVALHAAASSVNGDHDLFLPDVSKCQNRQEHRE